MIDLNALPSLPTETRNPRSTIIDEVSTAELCSIINDEDATIAGVVKNCIPKISAAIDTITPRIRQGGRLIYVGAGTSGRLGVLDASEITPTYSAPPEQFVGLIAGGDVALRMSQEGAEDSLEGAVRDLQALNLNGDVDSLIGIAASGRTPYVLSCLAFARSKGCVTIGVACVSSSSLAQSGNVDYMIDPVTGPEAITGSTRMKAGTATKLVLNMISTGIMIRTGKTFGNIMIDVKPTNVKLQIRARRILREICGDRCPQSDQELDHILQECDRSVKLSAVRIWLGISTSEAQGRLDQNGGVLAPLLKSPETSVVQSHSHNEESQLQYVLCVDGGGSKCRAVLFSNTGFMSEGEAGPCNPSDIGIDAAVSAIQKAIQRAVDSNLFITSGRIEGLALASVSIGLAGGDREPLRARMLFEIGQLFGAHSRSKVSITNDLNMLAQAPGTPPGVKNVVVMVAGTGSIAIHYRWEKDELMQVGRSGGWGALLGDDGSGFDIGRQAVRFALRERNINVSGSEDPDPLPDIVRKFFSPSSNVSNDCDLLTSVLLSTANDAQNAAYTKRRIASCAKAVVDAMTISKQAQSIVNSAMQSLVDLVLPLASRIEASGSNTVLVVTGGLMHSKILRQCFRNQLTSAGVATEHLEFIEDAALTGAKYLAQRAWT